MKAMHPCSIQRLENAHARTSSVCAAVQCVVSMGLMHIVTLVEGVEVVWAISGRALMHVLEIECEVGVGRCTLFLAWRCGRLENARVRKQA